MAANTNPAILNNPIYSGNAIWTYVNVMRGPVSGPQPRLAQGSGQTGDPGLPGNAPSLPGYLSDQQYFPNVFEYAPVNNEKFTHAIPKFIGIGQDGRDMVGTYVPHASHPGTRFFHQARSAENWQVMEYPPDFRNLLAYQQVMKYRTQSFVLSSRPLDSSNYFLGYQINPAVAAQIGGSSGGYLGSS